MRDLQGIAEINGPNWKKLQQDRAENIIAHSHRGLSPKEFRKVHGERVEVREATNR